MLGKILPSFAILILALGAVYLSFTSLQKSTNPTPEAAENSEQQASLGLNVVVSNVNNDVVSLLASWNPSLITNNLFKITGVIKNEQNDRKQRDDEPGDLGTGSSKAYTLAACPGKYYFRLRLINKNGSTKFQEQNFDYQLPLLDGSQLVSGNPSFEQTKIRPNNPNDLDPECFVTAEGLMEWINDGKESGIEKTQHPEMATVIKSTNSITPRSGTYMLKNSSQKGLKSHFRQSFYPPVTNGTLVQKLSLYIPQQTEGFLQQMELRRAVAGEEFHARWTNKATNYCWRTKDELSGGGADFAKDYCFTNSPLSPNTWHDYVITAQKLPDSIDQWKITITLDRQTVKESNGTTVPNLLPHNNQIGYIFVGDECQKQGTPCDGYGTIYYDDVTSTYTPY